MDNPNTISQPPPLPYQPASIQTQGLHLDKARKEHFPQVQTDHLTSRGRDHQVQKKDVHIRGVLVAKV